MKRHSLLLLFACIASLVSADPIGPSQAIKIASARPEFASTDTFLEMIGFDQADIRRIKAQETRQRGLSVLKELE